MRGTSEQVRLSEPGADSIVAYRRGALRGLCVADYESLDLTAIPWDNLKNADDPRHELAKSSRTRRVVRFDFIARDGRPRAVYAKRTAIRDWRKRLGCLFVRSKARREWDSGHRLLAMGFATARPVVYAEKWQGPWLEASYLVTEEIVGARPLRLELEQIASAAERRALLEQLADWLWRAHRQGFYHDDFSAQHVFVGRERASTEHQQPVFWIIDLDNCRFFRRAVPWRRRVVNLFQILRSIPSSRLGPTDRLRFVEFYLQISGESHRLASAIARMRRLAEAKQADVYL